MPDVGRQRQHRLVHVDALLLPQQDAPDHEGVPQIVDARRMMRTAVGPAQVAAQCGEDALHLVPADRLAEQAPPRADEERRVVVA
jgi:hypothetical protein